MLNGFTMAWFHHKSESYPKILLLFIIGKIYFDELIFLYCKANNSANMTNKMSEIVLHVKNSNE